MTSFRSIYHLARADFLERTRRYSFLITLGLILFLAYSYVPSRDAGYITLAVDGARGIYNSAWVGSLVAILTGIMLPLLGFYLVKNAVARDTQTGVGQIMATTPLTRPVYTLGKWLSNFAVLALMAGVTALAAVVLQLARGEDRQLDLLALFAPMLWIMLPTLALVAALAVLFETVGWLRGGLGNVIYFFVCTAVTMVSFLPVMMSAGNLEAAALPVDVFGIGLPLGSMLHAASAAFPGVDVHMSVVKFLVFVGDGVRSQTLHQATRAKMQMELVSRAAIDEEQAQRTKCVDSAIDHLDRIPGTPACPDILAECAGGAVKRQRQAQRCRRLGRIAGRHGNDHQHLDITPAFFRLGLKRLPPSLQPARRVNRVGRLGKVGLEAQFERAITTMARDRSEQIGVAHAHNQRSVAAAGFSKHSAAGSVGDRAIAAIDEWHEFLGEIIRISAGGRGVHVLAAAEAREAIGEHDNGRWHTGGVEPLKPCAQIEVPGPDMEQHFATAGVAGQAIDDRVAAV